MSREYSLRDMFVEAKISPAQIPDWFPEIKLRHPSIEGFRPRFHQITGLNLMFTHTRCALFDEQGTGKTLPAQAALVWHAAVGNRPVALMPPVLMEQFKDSFETTFEGIGQHVQMQFYKGTVAQRSALLDKWKASQKLPIIVMTPEIFRKEFAAFMELDCCALFCDECKYWANPESDTFKAIAHFLGAPGQKVLVGMNGTPAKNNLADLYGYIKLLSPSCYRSRLHFYSRHVEQKEVNIRYNKSGNLVERKIKVIDRFINTDTLRNNLYEHARRVEKKDVIDIPEKQIIEVAVKLSAAHEKAYINFCTARFVEFSDGTALSGEQTATLRQVAAQSVVNTEILKVKESSAVLEAVETLLDSIDLDASKVVIAAYYNKTVELLAERLKSFNPAVIYGPSGSRNAKEAERFKTEGDCKICIVNYQSGGVGLNFQDVCHYGIAAEPTTVPGDFDQWTDRMHRSGQKKKTTIYTIVPKNTIWVKMNQAMLKKKAWNKSVVATDLLKKELLGQPE